MGRHSTVSVGDSCVSLWCLELWPPSWANEASEARMSWRALGCWAEMARSSPWWTVEPWKEPRLGLLNVAFAIVWNDHLLLFHFPPSQSLSRWDLLLNRLCNSRARSTSPRHAREVEKCQKLCVAFCVYLSFVENLAITGKHKRNKKFSIPHYRREALSTF